MNFNLFCFLKVEVIEYLEVYMLFIYCCCSAWQDSGTATIYRHDIDVARIELRLYSYVDKIHYFYTVSPKTFSF